MEDKFLEYIENINRELLQEKNIQYIDANKLTADSYNQHINNNPGYSFKGIGKGNQVLFVDKYNNLARLLANGKITSYKKNQQNQGLPEIDSNKTAAFNQKLGLGGENPSIQGKQDPNNTPNGGNVNMLDQDPNPDGNDNIKDTQDPNQGTQVEGENFNALGYLSRQEIVALQPQVQKMLATSKIQIQDKLEKVLGKVEVKVNPGKVLKGTYKESLIQYFKKLNEAGETDKVTPPQNPSTTQVTMSQEEYNKLKGSSTSGVKGPTEMEIIVTVSPISSNSGNQQTQQKESIDEFCNFLDKIRESTLNESGEELLNNSGNTEAPVNSANGDNAGNASQDPVNSNEKDFENNNTEENNKPTAVLNSDFLTRNCGDIKNIVISNLNKGLQLSDKVNGKVVQNKVVSNVTVEDSGKEPVITDNSITFTVYLNKQKSKTKGGMKDILAWVGKDLLNGVKGASQAFSTQKLN